MNRKFNLIEVPFGRFEDLCLKNNIRRQAFDFKTEDRARRKYFEMIDERRYENIAEVIKDVNDGNSLLNFIAISGRIGISEGRKALKRGFRNFCEELASTEKEYDKLAAGMRSRSRQGDDLFEFHKIGNEWILRFFNIWGSNFGEYRFETQRRIYLDSRRTKALLGVFDGF